MCLLLLVGVAMSVCRRRYPSYRNIHLQQHTHRHSYSVAVGMKRGESAQRLETVIYWRCANLCILLSAYGVSVSELVFPMASGGYVYVYVCVYYLCCIWKTAFVEEKGISPLPMAHTHIYIYICIYIHTYIPLKCSLSLIFYALSVWRLIGCRW